MKKILLVTLLLAGMIISGSALQCYFCVPESGKPCNPTIENCGPGKDTCFQGVRSIPSLIQKKCMRMEECEDKRDSRSMRVQCCQTDLCNK
ncbi:CD59A glycoprotein [Astyanax mexicanus]|uniref:CD59A glycoprotein-like n=1 Tax=Astyanax mexicanus TaxID=7994 RepID=A0A8T2M693_ASTMX|nr:CD59A glycoprotein [Astyanax mexicanus]KAG9278637.1 CD59A glycoprotein-like [Astyanax mexicanus]